MDGYGTLRYKLGGTPFDRSAPTGEGADKAISVLPTGFWVDNAFELAAFAYYLFPWLIAEARYEALKLEMFLNHQII